MIHYIDNPKHMDLVNDFLSSARYISWDLETGPRPEWIGTEFEEKAGLDPYLGQPYLTLIGDLQNHFIIDHRCNPDLTWVGKAIENPDLPKHGVNMRFDAKYAILHYDWRPRRLIDSMIIEQVTRVGLFSATKEAKVGLVRKMTSMGSLVKRYFDIDIDKDKEMRKTFWKTPMGGYSERQIEYFGGDIEWPIKIAQKQAPLVKQRGLVDKLRTESRLIPVLARMELAGMGLEQDEWLDLYNQSCSDVVKYEKELDRIFKIQAYKQDDLFGAPTQTKRKINYGSSAQLARQLHKHGIKGFVDPKTNKTLSTESKLFTIGKLKKEIPEDLADAMVSMRKAEQRRDSYGLNFIKKVHPVTGRVHPDFTQTILVTSRISCSPGLQTIPRDKAYRHAFQPKKGYVLSIVDASQIEARIMADMTMDIPAIEVFKSGGDLYSVDGEKLYGVPIDRTTPEGKKLRDNAKAAWLGLGYGQGKDSFHLYCVVTLNRWIDKDETDHLYDKFFELHWRMKEEMDHWSALGDPEFSDEWFEDSLAKRLIKTSEAYPILYDNMLRKSRGDEVKAAKRARIILSHPERVRYSTCFGGGKRFHRVDYFGWYNAARNFPVQGGAALIQKESLIDIDEFIYENDIDACIPNAVHDEILVEVREDQAEEFHEHHKRLMVDAGQKYLQHVPMKVEGGLAEVWKKF